MVAIKERSCQKKPFGFYLKPLSYHSKVSRIRSNFFNLLLGHKIDHKPFEFWNFISDIKLS